jgi:hypothetical protein
MFEEGDKMKKILVLITLSITVFAHGSELTIYEKVLLKKVLGQDMSMDVYVAGTLDDDLRKDRVSPLSQALSDCNSANTLIQIMNDENNDVYKRFNAARGLAYLDDVNAVDILENTLLHGFAMTSSGFEQSEAASCLLYVGHDFPEDFLFSRLPNALFPELDIFLTRVHLPEEYLGVWSFSHSSGGIDGKGDMSYSVDRIEILADNTIYEYQNGMRASCRRFYPTQGKSILFEETVWMITFDGEDYSRVLWFDSNGFLNVSDNLHDGFQYTYKRITRDCATTSTMGLREDFSAPEFKAALVGKWESVYTYKNKPNIQHMEITTDGNISLTVTTADQSQQHSGPYTITFDREPAAGIVTFATITINPGDPEPIVLSRVNFGLHNGIPLDEGIVLRIDKEPYGVLKKTN